MAENTYMLCNSTKPVNWQVVKDGVRGCSPLATVVLQHPLRVESRSVSRETAAPALAGAVRGWLNANREG